MVRLVHTSDTHLGHAQYARSDPRTGLNQREQDHYDAWATLIDQVLADPPDLFLHAGDLFDGVRPSNRALAAAMDGLLRLSRAGIETVLIAGNHETPKMRGTGSPFRLFEHLPHIHPVYRGRAESLHLAGATVHAVPQCPDHDSLRAQVGGLQAGPGPNILMLHGAVQSLEAFRHAEFNEQTLDPAWFGRFDYVALGHYHGITQVQPNAWYCGAPDRVSMGEAGEEKGYLRIDLAWPPSEAGGPTSAPAQVQFVALPIRTYVDLPPIHAGGLDAAAVDAAAKQALARVPEGAVARLRLRDVDASLRGGLDQRAIRAAGAHALHVDLRVEWSDRQHLVQGGVELGPIEQEFAAFLRQQPIEGVERNRIQEMAATLLRDAQEAA